MNGIDVSAADGKIDWAGAYAEGVEFALVRASAGMCADPRFRENVFAADGAGLSVGVYHDLHADGAAEAALFLSLLAPLRGVIRLWAICRAENVAADVHGFLAAVDKAGLSPMLAAPPQVIDRLPDARQYPLWLLCWGTTEARALAYAPRIWQYGAGRIAAMPRVHVNRGYFGE